MRFLFGLIIGAMVTIVVATAMDAPTHVVLNDIRDSWRELVEKVQQKDPPNVAEIHPNQSLDDELPPAQPAPPSPWLPVPSAESPNDLAEQSSTKRDELTPGTGSPSSPLDARGVPIDVREPSAVAGKQTSGAETAMEATEAPATEPSVSFDVSSSAAVWEPFYSEVSASGFAKRLSLQLGYPFQVAKDGPARYLVVFDYETESERALLEQQIATLTGYKPR